MNCTVFGGTSPMTVTWWSSTTVEKADEEPKRVGPSVPLVSGLRGSTNTDTDATPSEYTRCSTGSLEPGKDCEERVVRRKPGGSLMASQSADDALIAICCSGRSHLNRDASTCGLNIESGMRSGKSMVEKRICSITAPDLSQSCVFSGMELSSSIHRR